MPKLKNYTDAEFKKAVIDNLSRIEKKLDSLASNHVKEAKAEALSKQITKTLFKHQKT
jgi:hypothetical protein